MCFSSNRGCYSSNFVMILRPCVVNRYLKLQFSAASALNAVVKTLPNFLSSFVADIILKVWLLSWLPAFLATCCVSHAL